MRKEHGSLKSKLDRFLLRYRLIPHTTTGEPPAVLLTGRLPRSRLDILRPDVGERTRQRKEQQRYQHDRTSRERNLGIGQPVFLKNFGTGESWVNKGQPSSSHPFKPVRNNAVPGRRSTRTQRGLQRRLERSPQSGDPIKNG